VVVDTGKHLTDTQANDWYSSKWLILKQMTGTQANDW